jgi:hypothetical protein
LEKEEDASCLELKNLLLQNDFQLTVETNSHLAVAAWHSGHRVRLGIEQKIPGSNSARV